MGEREPDSNRQILETEQEESEYPYSEESLKAKGDSELSEADIQRLQGD